MLKFDFKAPGRSRSEWMQSLPSTDWEQHNYIQDDLEFGDCTIHHTSCPHAGNANTSESAQYSLFLNWPCDDAGIAGPLILTNIVPNPKTQSQHSLIPTLKQSFSIFYRGYGPRRRVLRVLENSSRCTPNITVNLTGVTSVFVNTTNPKTKI